MPDVQIYSGKKVAAPSTYELPLQAEFILKCVNADFDGSGAAGDYLPCVTLLSDSGQVIARAVDQDVKVTAGSDAEVSWFPRVRRRRDGVTPSGVNCVLLGKGNGTDTLTITLDTAVPGPGVLQVVYCQVTENNHTDTGSAPTAATDSAAAHAWTLTFTNKPLIGQSRETDTGVPVDATSQIGSVAREAFAGDLGIGGTVTVTFGTGFPAQFKTAGLVIWQKSYWEAITQGGIIRYNRNDAGIGDGLTPVTLAWDVDYFPGITKPNLDGDMITAMGAYPATAGFTPFAGTLIGEIATGPCSIAAGCVSTADTDAPDPGGVWPAGPKQVMGNYQYARPRPYSL